jgi:hypothetical protein
VTPVFQQKRKPFFWSVLKRRLRMPKKVLVGQSNACPAIFKAVFGFLHFQNDALDLLPLSSMTKNKQVLQQKDML